LAAFGLKWIVRRLHDAAGRTNFRLLNLGSAYNVGWIMEDLQFPTPAANLGRYLGAEIVGNGDSPVERLSPLQTAGEGSLAYFASRKYAEFLPRVHGAVVLTSKEVVDPALPLTYVVVDNPQNAFAGLARRFSLRPSWQGVSTKAEISPSAQIGEGVSIGPFAFVGERAVIGSGSQVYPFAFIGADVKIGADCQIHPHATLLDRVRIGDRVKIFSGAVIGSDGFGLMTAKGGAVRHDEMPQIGTVVIEDDVRVGAKCTIDRGTVGETRIGQGSKLDDQVHVAHNVQLGRNVILCAQVGLAGSVVLEDDVILGGQVGLGNGVHVGKGAAMGGQSGSSVDLNGGEVYNLTPAVPVRESMRINRYTRKLPEIWRRLKELEAKLDGDKL